MKILDVPRSGSYQGITSSRNRFGQYVRTRASPVNPNSPAQAEVRGRLAAQSSAWRGLTDEQRAAWQSLGLQMVRTDSLGQSYDLQGIQAYVSVNSNNVAAGNAVVSDAPVILTPDALLSVTPTAVESTSFSIAFTPTPLGAGQRVFIFASPQISPGRNFVNDLRLIHVSAAAAASPADIYAEYVAKFGDSFIGQAVMVAAAVYDSGFLSIPVRAKAIVA
jgi:hypothetical protein